MILTFCCLICFVIYQLLFERRKDDEFSEGERILIHTAMDTVVEFNEPYELRIAGFGFEAEKDTGNYLLVEFSLILSYETPIEKTKSRELLVYFVESYINKINEKHDFNRYFYKTSFTDKEFDLILVPRHSVRPLYPEIYSIKLHDGVVTYETIENDEDQFSDYETETFEEAQRIVHESTNINDSAK